MPRYKGPTGYEITGTLELIRGEALIQEISVTGEPVYAGDIEVFWDSQETVERDGKTVFIDGNGDEWTFDQLTEINENDDDDGQ